MKKNFMKILIGLLIVFSGVFYIKSFKEEETNLIDKENTLKALKSEKESEKTGNSSLEKTVNSTDGFTFSQYKLEVSQGGKYNFDLKDPEFFYIKDGEVVPSLDFEEIPKDSIIYAKTEDGNFLFSLAYYVKEIADGNYRVNFDGEREFTSSELRYNFPSSNDDGYFWTISSNEDFLYDSIDLIKGLNNKNGLILDGYYYISNEGYKPNGPDIFYRNPAIYVVKNFKDNKLQKVLLYSLLSYMKPIIEEKGYVPIPVESLWLKSDYNIDSYYYDTRWNSDLGEIIIDAYSIYKDPDLLVLNEKIIEYTKKHIDGNKYLINEDSYLVADYSHEKGTHKKTHASLNHHLQIMNWFIKTYIVTGDDSIKEYAMGMLSGVLETSESWIKSNNDLYYAYSEGGFIRDDYERLTLNDLLKARILIEKAFDMKDTGIDKMIERKEIWLKAKE